MENQQVEQRMMQPYVIEIFESFVGSFYTALYEQLLEEMSNPKFSAELMKRQSEWKQSLQQLLTAQFEVNITSLASIENLQLMKAVYIEIAQSCAAFQMTVAELLHKHYPEKYPDYFLTAYRDVEHKIVIQVQEKVQFYEQEVAQIQQQQQALQLELEQSQSACIRAAEKIQLFEQTASAHETKIKQLTDEVKHKEHQLQQRITDNAQLTEQIETLQQNRVDVPAVLSSVSDKFKQATKQNIKMFTKAEQPSDLESVQNVEQNEALQAQIKALQAENKALQQELVNQQQVNERLSHKVEARPVSSNTSSDVAQAFERLKEKYDTDTAKLKAQLNKFSTLRPATQAPVASMSGNDEIEALKKQLADTEHKLEYFRKNNEKVVQQYLELLNNQ